MGRCRDPLGQLVAQLVKKFNIGIVQMRKRTSPDDQGLPRKTWRATYSGVERPDGGQAGAAGNSLHVDTTRPSATR